MTWVHLTPFSISNRSTKGIIGVQRVLSFMFLFPCVFDIAEGEIRWILRNDCSPVIHAILVTNDNKSRHETGTSEGNHLSHEPQFNAEDTREVLQNALETFGATVIAVKNQSKEFLLAIIESLKKSAVPKIEFLWFIFSGHGRGSSFSLNGEFMEFDELINETSKIDAQFSVFFFECCQVDGEGVKVTKLQSQHMVVYSAPPNEVSFHYDGVGLMASTLAELLLMDYPKPLNKLQLELRQRLSKRIVAVNKVPPEGEEDFKNKHLPVQTTTIREDINLYEKIQAASKLNSEFRGGGGGGVVY